MISDKREVLRVLYNRPGLNALAYRATIHAESRRRMLDRLSRHAIPAGVRAGVRPLAALTTRDSGDPVVALIDAWAAAVDVLTFYQERIANEGYLATCTEWRSLRELANTIGYALAPGIAACAYLAFFVEDAADSPSRIKLPMGTQVQSVPGQDELPQTFETATEFTARADWNALRPRFMQRQVLTTNQDLLVANSLYFQGLGIALRPGDLIEIAGANVKAQILRVAQSIPDPATDCTRADVIAPQKIEGAAAVPSDRAWRFRQRVGFFGSDAQPWSSLPKPDGKYVQGTDLYADAAKSSWDDADGRNKCSIWQNSWGKYYFAATDAVDVCLEQVIPEILPGSRVIFCDPTRAYAYEVQSAIPLTIMGYGRTARVTGLKLKLAESVRSALKENRAPTPDLPKFLVRETVAYVQAEPLLLAESAPMPASINVAGAANAEVPLDRRVADLEVGQLVAVQGERADAAGTSISEIAEIREVRHDGAHGPTTLRLGLKYSYLRATLSINANVVLAGHGETIKDEVLGSGDSGKRNQSFALRRSPLTYVISTESGLPRSTLSIRVNDIEWTEVHSLYEVDRRAQRFMLRTDDEGRATVIFGDGEHGACLPSGQNNVVASYRVGIGPSGEVAAGALQLPLNPPLGLRSVCNPLPAADAVPAEAAAQARQEMPLRISTLDRVVALQDYQSFAAAYPGIAKAQAVLVRKEGAPIVHITVAAEQGQALPGERLAALLRAFGSVSDPRQKVILSNFRALPFTIGARIDVAPGYLPNRVRELVAQALRQAFCFDSRRFGQSVNQDEVSAVMHQVAGVTGASNPTLLGVPNRLLEPAQCDAADPAQWLGAELLFLQDVELEGST